MPKPPSRLQRIVSGGQTGVDRAALDAALEKGFPVGGWCPAGRLAEDGPIPNRYPLRELPGASYRKRTHQNVIDSDGTLILYFGQLQGGTLVTLTFCNQHRKPNLLLDGNELSLPRMIAKALNWLHDNDISALNVAGPRASGDSRAYSCCKNLISSVLDSLSDNGKASPDRHDNGPDTPRGVRLSGLDHLVLTVTDMDRTLAFYRDLLGMSVHEEVNGRRALVLAGQQIKLHMAGREVTPHAAQPCPGSADLCFLIDGDLDAARRLLHSSGVEILLGPVERNGAAGRILSLYLRDPDGNLIEIARPL